MKTMEEKLQDIKDDRKREKLVMAVVPEAKNMAWETSRAFRELPAQDSVDGASEVARLTAWARSQDAALEPVIAALLHLRKITWDPDRVFMIINDASRIDWMTLPRRSYPSFEEFYRLELEPTWGKWSELERDWTEVTRGTKTAEQVMADIKVRVQKADAEDRKNQRPAGRPSAEIVDNSENDINNFEERPEERPTGTSVKAALRRLRKDREDLHARVMAGEMTPHAAMVEAGFRKARGPDPRPGLSALRRAWKRASADERDTFREEIENT